MTRRSRRRVLIYLIAVLIIGAAALVEHSARQCLESGGRFEWMSARCELGLPIILDRGLRRT
jgi:hypothetical protein